jgi:hypothetical protein
MTSKDKKIKPVTGQLFAVPLLDGSQGLAQIAFARKIGARAYTVSLAFFPVRTASIGELMEKIGSVSLELPFAVISPSGTPVEDGAIQFIGTADAAYQNVDVQSRLKGSYLWFDGKQQPWRFIFDMYYGLYPWDAFYKKNWMDELLLREFHRPETAKLKKDFNPEELERLGLRN